MLIDRLSKNREKKKKLVHIIAVFLILIHAFEKYDSGHGSYFFFYCRPGIYISCLISSGDRKESALDRWSFFL